MFDLPAELRSYAERYPDEAKIADLFLTFVEGTPDCFLREHLAGHMTGSAFVIDGTCSETLLVHHRKLRLWVQPGGHADGNPQLQEVAEQELQEETGMTRYVSVAPSIFDIDRHSIPERAGIPAHYHYDVRFLFRAERNQQLIVSDESIDLRWFSLAAIVGGDLARQGIATDESVRRMAQKASY